MSWRFAATGRLCSLETLRKSVEGTGGWVIDENFPFESSVMTLSFLPSAVEGLGEDAAPKDLGRSGANVGLGGTAGPKRV